MDIQYYSGILGSDQHLAMAESELKKLKDEISFRRGKLLASAIESRFPDLFSLYTPELTSLTRRIGWYPMDSFKNLSYAPAFLNDLFGLTDFERSLLIAKKLSQADISILSTQYSLDGEILDEEYLPIEGDPFYHPETGEIDEEARGRIFISFRVGNFLLGTDE